ncbi:MAG TPA: hypothetical protein VHV55_14060 [Pirellulales bacterium]|jgi:hypothetical protein|nr:hypothetical protein [Pirellulales bacterium]
MRPALCHLLLLLASLALATAAEAQQSLAPDQGLLLLDGGQVLRGKITRAGDYYFVSLGDGEIRVKSSNVELFCHTLDEGYQRKRTNIAQGTALDHLNLAQWCLHQGLLGYAAKEVSAAIDLDPLQPRIPLLERRLELARSQQEEAEKHVASTETALSNEDLDRLVRGMPAGTVDYFAHTIQPLILNHCSTAGCHGPDSNTGYKLMRFSLGHTPNRRLTQRNLFATLEHINAADPALSPLLQQAIREHGSAKTAVFTTRDAVQYRQLVIWVYRVSKSAPPPQVETVTEPAAPLLQTLPGRETPAQPAGKPPDSPGVRRLKEGLAAQHRPPVKPQPPSRLPPAAGSQTAESAEKPPADPLDPAVFNERFAAPK